MADGTKGVGERTGGSARREGWRGARLLLGASLGKAGETEGERERKQDDNRTYQTDLVPQKRVDSSFD